MELVGRGLLNTNNSPHAAEVQPTRSGKHSGFSQTGQESLHNVPLAKETGHVDMYTSGLESGPGNSF